MSPRAVGLAVVGVLAGALFVNALPHLVHGGLGQPFPTLLGVPRSAAANLGWGLANLFLGVTLAVVVWNGLRTLPFLAGAGAGSLATATVLLVVMG
ncbi:hypothetical protein [Polymorphospora rubra]|uniref:hypothetical protein n=1 Tax=Polymorphospora rubra TaxID=338584 RepID=UPI001BB31034|nr:hypothetical protein [Polymorphospora rubra]